MDNSNIDTKPMFTREYEIAKKIIEAYETIHNSGKVIKRIAFSNETREEKVTQLDEYAQDKSIAMLYLSGIQLSEKILIVKKDGQIMIVR